MTDSTPNAQINRQRLILNLGASSDKVLINYNSSKPALTWDVAVFCLLVLAYGRVFEKANKPSGQNHTLLQTTFSAILPTGKGQKG